jgi:hypothetical protein
LDYYSEDNKSHITITGSVMKMKSKRRQKRKKAYDRVLVDGYGQEYHFVEKRPPGRRKGVYSTYVVQRKRMGKDFWIDIALQWLVRLIASLLPIGDWCSSE